MLVSFARHAIGGGRALDGRKIRVLPGRSSLHWARSFWCGIHIRSFLHGRLDFDVRSLNFWQQSRTRLLQQPLVTLIARQTLHQLDVVKRRCLGQRVLSCGIGLTRTVRQRLSVDVIDGLDHGIPRMLRQQGQVGQGERDRQQYDGEESE